MMVEADQSFYINQDGKVVIYFDPIIIAPLEKGPQEFIIEYPIEDQGIVGSKL